MGPPCATPNCRWPTGSLRSPSWGSARAFSRRQAFQALTPSFSLLTCSDLGIARRHSPVPRAAARDPRLNRNWIRPRIKPCHDPAGRLVDVCRISSAHIRYEIAQISDNFRIIKMRLRVEDGCGRIEAPFDAETPAAHFGTGQSSPDHGELAVGIAAQGLVDIEIPVKSVVRIERGFPERHPLVADATGKTKDIGVLLIAQRHIPNVVHGCGWEKAVDDGRIVANEIAGQRIHIMGDLARG